MDFIVKSILVLGLGGGLAFMFAAHAVSVRSKAWQRVVISLSILSVITGGLWSSMILFEFISSAVKQMSIADWLVVIITPITMTLGISLQAFRPILNVKARDN